VNPVSRRTAEIRVLRVTRKVIGPYTGREMSTEPIRTSHGESLELPAAELLRRARPLPPHEDMVIDDLTEEECAAFLAALEA
jgi:hypothetical protein